MDLRQAVRDMASGKLSYDELVTQFSAARFPKPGQRPANDDWGQVYLRAEEGTPQDAATILSAAKFAKQITPAQYDQLMQIERQKSSQAPATAPSASMEGAT